ncbi:substrate-binding periplasmic protein [Roseateles sp.]|uniref:substrate-binding periplasmic protein n=1 Tax=Roseateles sp. TaxID=1971397 RepID=UPI003D0DB22E
MAIDSDHGDGDLQIGGAPQRFLGWVLGCSQRGYGAGGNTKCRDDSGRGRPVLRHIAIWGVQALLVFVVPLAHADSGILVVYAEQYRPYSWQDGTRVQGLEVELAEEILQHRMGLVVEHRVLPWARAQADVSMGNADFFFAVETPDRNLFSRPIGGGLIPWRASVFVRSKDGGGLSGETIGLDVLCGPKTGAVRGNGWVKKHLPCGTLSLANSPQALVRMLLMKRTDLIVDDGLMLRSTARQLQVENDLLEIPLKGESVSIQFRISLKSSHRALIPQLEKAIDAMRVDGTLKRIIGQYAEPLRP